MNWRTISAELAALPKILLSRSLKTCFHFRVVFADSLHLSTEYLAKSQPRTSPCRTRWPLGHRSKEICAFSTVSFDKTSARPLHLVQVLVLPPDDITRRLKKPEFYLSTTITIRVEMTSLITHESHSDYQHTSILTHSNSTTTTIRWKNPDFVLQQSRKKNCYCWFHRMRMFSDTAVLVKTPSEWENISIIENNHVSPLKKESASCSGRIESGKPWARERNWKGGDAVLSCSVTVLDIKPLLQSKKSSYGLQTE